MIGSYKRKILILTYGNILLQNIEGGKTKICR